MLVHKRHNTKGDTLIEALFAITIFSLVAVGGLAIMNQGTATAQRALEITLVRNQIDAQAETLRYLNSSYIAAYQPGVSGCTDDPSNINLGSPANQWQLMQCYIANHSAKPSSIAFSDTSCPQNQSGYNPSDDGWFILNTKKASFVAPAGQFTTAQTYSQVRYNAGDQVTTADGIWIVPIRAATVAGNNQDNAGYIDFYIRACWDSPGQSVPVTIGTIVRLYEPRG